MDSTGVEVRRLEQRVEALRNELAMLNESRSKLKEWKAHAVRKEIFNTVRQTPGRRKVSIRQSRRWDSYEKRPREQRQRLEEDKHQRSNTYSTSRTSKKAERSVLKLAPLSLALPVSVEDMQKEALEELSKCCKQKCSPLKSIRVDEEDIGTNLRKAAAIEVRLHRVVAESCVRLKLLPIIRRNEAKRMREALAMLRLFPGYTTAAIGSSGGGNNVKLNRMTMRRNGQNNYWVKIYRLVLEQLKARAADILRLRELRRESAIRLQCFVRRRKAIATLGGLVKEKILQLQVRFWDIFEPLLRYTPLDSSTTLSSLRSIGLKKKEATKLLRFIRICAERNGEFSRFNASGYLKDVHVMQRFMREDADAISKAVYHRKKTKLQENQARRQARRDELNAARLSELLEQSLRIQAVKQEKQRREDEWNVYQHLQSLSHKR